MDKYAVLNINGKQYLVKEKDEVLVDKILGSSPDPKVLLVVDADRVRIGKPQLKEHGVSLKILEKEIKGRKMKVFKYKALSKNKRV